MLGAVLSQRAFVLRQRAWYQAMGANMINTTAEYMAPRIEQLTGGKVPVDPTRCLCHARY
eukprot:2043102-Rhodomonas_salina.1